MITAEPARQRATYGLSCRRAGDPHRPSYSIANSPFSGFVSMTWAAS